MNRRDLFKALIAVGASAALIDRLSAREVLGPITAPLTVGPEGSVEFESISQLSCSSVEETSRAVTFALRRAESHIVLLSHRFNALGGTYVYAFPPGGEIVVTRANRIDLLGDFDGAMSILTRTSDSRIRRYFWQMSRDNGPRLLNAEYSPIYTSASDTIPRDDELDALEDRS